MFSAAVSNAQDAITFEELYREVQQHIKAKDTTAISAVFQRLDTLKTNQDFKELDVFFFKLKFERARFLSAYSKVSADSAIALFKELHTDAVAKNHHDLAALALDKIATGYRSKRQFDKAFEYNQMEIRSARKSDNPSHLGRALITELDIAYNSLPWPIQKSDLDELVVKSTYVIDYAQENNLPLISSFGKLYLSKFYIKQEAYENAKVILEGIDNTEPLNVVFSKYEHLCEIAKATTNLADYRAYTLEFKKYAYRTKRAFVALNAHNYLLDYFVNVKNRDSSKYYAQLLEQNLQQVDTTKYLDFLDVSYTTLAKYFSEENPKKELQYRVYSAKVNKVIADRQREAFSAILKYKTEVAKLELENDELNNAKSWFKNNFWRSIGILALLVTILFLLFRKYRKSQTTVQTVTEEKQRIVEKVSRKSIELHNKQRVYFDELIYLKSDRNYVEFYTASKRYVDRHKLSAVQEHLPPNFVQVHRSYVINKNKIKSSTGSYVLLTPDIEIPLSRTFKHRLNQQM